MGGGGAKVVITNVPAISYTLLHPLCTFHRNNPTVKKGLTVWGEERGTRYRTLSLFQNVLCWKFHRNGKMLLWTTEVQCSIPVLFLPMQERVWSSKSKSLALRMPALSECSTLALSAEHQDINSPF
jgi:hypothetical protein